MSQSALLKGSVLVSLSLFIAHGLLAQENDRAAILTRIPQTEARIILDGVLDEPAWQRVPIIDDMRVIQPDTLVTLKFFTTHAASTWA